MCRRRPAEPVRIRWYPASRSTREAKGDPVLAKKNKESKQANLEAGLRAPDGPQLLRVALSVPTFVVTKAND